jgi:hypothetical protein
MIELNRRWAEAGMGAANGLFIWRHSDDGGRRYSNCVAQYGHAPEQGTLDEHLDYTMYELRGPTPCDPGATDADNGVAPEAVAA